MKCIYYKMREKNSEDYSTKIEIFDNEDFTRGYLKDLKRQGYSFRRISRERYLRAIRE